MEKYYKLKKSNNTSLNLIRDITIELNELKAKLQSGDSRPDALTDDSFDNLMKTFLTENEMQMLYNVPDSSNHDSAFIRLLLTFLYKNEGNTLLNRSIHGAKEHVRTLKNGNKIYVKHKEPITPQKINFISQVYHNRIHRLHLERSQFSERTKSKHINQLIANALNTLQRGIQEKEN